MYLVTFHCGTIIRTEWPFHNVSLFSFLVQLKECALCVSHPKADVYVDQMYAVYCKRVQLAGVTQKRRRRP